MAGKHWTRNEVLVAFNIYCRTPFGRLHARNPEIIRVARALGRTANALAMKCCNLAAFDPALQQRGIKGLQKTSKVDREVWEEFTLSPEDIGFECEEKFAEVVGDNLRIADKVEWQDVEGLDRTAVTKVRVNQHLFRTIVVTGYGSQCAVCRMSLAKLLIASHIVPWSVDTENRMNPRNGLCLCALHDRAYDAGIIHVDEDYTIKISSLADSHRDNEAVRRFLIEYEGTRIHLPERWLPDREFLKLHGELTKAG